MIMTPYEIATLTLGIIGGVFVVIQIYIGVRAYKAEHERQKKQATIEYVKAIRPLYREAKLKVDKKFGDKTLSEADVEELEKDFDTKESLKDLLSILEHAAVGMNAGVFDKDLWYRMSGSFLIRIYRRFYAYIKKAQQRQPSAYNEFLEIVIDFENRKKQKVDPSGNIRLS
jgi:hypothetical protein